MKTYPNKSESLHGDTVTKIEKYLFLKKINHFSQV